MKNLLIVFLFTSTGLFLLAYSSYAGEKLQPKIKNQFRYEICETGKDYLVSKTEFDTNGKKIKLTGYFEDGKESETINYVYENGILVKENVRWLNFDDEISEYTVTLKYDEQGRLLSEKYEGDYATDVSPDFFEYIYDDTGKLTEKYYYVTVIPDRPMGVEYREIFKYDEKGNRIEALLMGTKFDGYQEKTTYEYDDENLLINSTHDDGYGKISKFRYEYEYY